MKQDPNPKRTGVEGPNVQSVGPTQQAKGLNWIEPRTDQCDQEFFFLALTLQKQLDKLLPWTLFSKAK